MQKQKWWLAPVLFSTILLTGCVQKETIYHWGTYEQLLYDAYINPGEADTTTQIEKLNTDIQKASALGKKVAPGIYAHLGLLYALSGKDSQSKAAFSQEQALYPESRVFIQGMLDRAVKQQENQ